MNVFLNFFSNDERSVFFSGCMVLVDDDNGNDEFNGYSF